MEIKELKEFAKNSHQRIKKMIGLDGRELVFAHMIKLGEEFGEVNEEFLRSQNCCRKAKLTKENNLGHELADVIIVSSIIAESLGIDIEKSLSEKMKIVEERDKE